MKDFIKAFSDVLTEATESELTVELSGNTKYKELDGWGSLTAVMTIVMVEENYEKEITTDDFESCDTLESLFNLIQSKQ